MDYDGDGKRDLISGCFEGFFYLMRETGEGLYEQPQRLKDKNGKDLQAGKFWNYETDKWDELKDAVGKDLGLHPWALDWDGDGDLDVLLGGYGGTLNLRLNEGSRDKPAYSSENKPVQAGGKAIELQGGVSPVAADWDGDGRFDLVVADGGGRVCWYRNRAEKGAPEFEAARELLPPAGKGQGKEPRPAEYLKLAVGDLNGDGAPDLVIGARDQKREGRLWFYPHRAVKKAERYH